MSETLSERLNHLVEHLAHVLPSQAPIRDFVHHNTLHGFQDRPFREALSAASRLTGARGYLPNDQFRALYRRGRVTREDLEAVIAEQPELDGDAELLAGADGPILRRDVLIAGLLHPFRPVTASQLHWRMAEEGALDACQPDLPEAVREQWLRSARERGLAGEAAAVRDLWAACLEALNLSDVRLHPEELVARATEDEQDTAPALDEEEPGDDERNRVDRMMRKEALRLFDTHAERVGEDWTLRQWLLALTGEDLMEELVPPLTRLLAGHLDLGVAEARAPAGDAGLFAAWRATAERDLGWLLREVPDWRRQLARLPESATEVIEAELRERGLPEARWEGYLERLALDLPGWSGMVLWRHDHPGYEGREAPVDLIDYLAVRLVLERWLANRISHRHWGRDARPGALRGHFRRHPAEFSARYFLFNTRLPEYLTTPAQRLVEDAGQVSVATDEEAWRPLARRIWTWRQSPAADRPVGHSVYRSAWPLFRLAQHLGLGGAEVRAAGLEGAGALLDTLNTLSEERAGWLWLNAYERHYRERIFATLAANHGRGPWAERGATPEAQLVFCMDDREEGMRRHLEEINPAVETLGAGGFFGVPVAWRGLDDTVAAALCPPVVTPVNRVVEEPADGAEERGRSHHARRAARVRGRDAFMRGGSRGSVPAVVWNALGGLAAPLALLGKVVSPAAFAATMDRLRRGVDGRVPTRVTLNAADDGATPTPEQPRDGFTDAEQAARVAGFLRTIGLTDGFAPLVVMMGHGSHSQNNPHRSAYACGACSGRHGGPNARLFAAMANRPEVRRRLAEDGIVIPEGTHFIGAEHDTCDDRIEWFDDEAVPTARRDDLERLRAQLLEAGRRHARERIRRFASAPARPSLARAWRHVAGRAGDFSQARPELGHATNATAFIGRRAMSRGAFFDRRAFLISYDPTRDDADGSVLEALLLSAGPVGAGISLEYYFSTVDNEGYGSGSKVMHNLAGRFGVMEGTSSDLRTGLPRQMIEIHEPMRLLIVVEADTDVLTRIYQRQPPLQELVGNGWVQLAAKDPVSPRIERFDPEQGWVPWGGGGEAPPEVALSADWFAGHDEALEPALLSRATKRGGDA